MSTVLHFELLDDSDTRNKVRDTVVTVWSTQLQTACAVIEFNISINSQPKFGYSGVLQEWNLFNIDCKNHQCNSNVDLLDNIKYITINTCQQQFHNSQAIRVFLQSKVKNEDYKNFLIQHLDNKLKWRVKLNKVSYDYSHINSISNVDMTKNDSNYKIIINAWVNALPDYNNQLMMMLVFEKIPVFALFTRNLAAEIKCRETYRIPAVSKVSVGDDDVSMLPLENVNDYNFVTSTYNRLPYSDEIKLIDEKSIEWNDLDMILYDYSDVYLKMFSINVFVPIVFYLSNVFFAWMCLGINVSHCNDLNRVWKIYLEKNLLVMNRNSNVLISAKMNGHKFLRHMKWFISKEADSGYNSVLFEYSVDVRARDINLSSILHCSYNTCIESIMQKETMCQLAYDNNIKEMQCYYFQNYSEHEYSFLT